MRHSNKHFYLKLFLALTATFIVSACCTTKEAPHNGLFPFSMWEKPQSLKKVSKQHPNPQKLELQWQYSPEQPNSFSDIAQRIQPGDVIAFYMSHKEARKHLRKGTIQKIPYELFAYGHVALVVPTESQQLHLLQVAMKQHINSTSDLSYLRDKSWALYRPPSGSIDVAKLQQFSQIVCSEDKGKSDYDYLATFGVKNGNLTPQSPHQIREKYTCATLVVAGLSYSGFELHTPRRAGIADIITPRQVIDSFGTKK